MTKHLNSAQLPDNHAVSAPDPIGEPWHDTEQMHDTEPMHAAQSSSGPISCVANSAAAPSANIPPNEMLRSRDDYAVQHGDTTMDCHSRTTATTNFHQRLRQRLAQIKMPSAAQLAQSRWLKPFARHLQQPSFWQWQADNVSRAVGIGLFWAWQPLPLQMVGAVWCAIYFRAHIGLAVAMVWVNNPFTLGFIFYGNYAVGVWLFNRWQPTAMLSLTELNWTVLPPLLLGSVVVGLGIALLSSVLVRCGWRIFKPGI